MDSSSPLAAMHRPSAVPSWCKRDIFSLASHPHYGGGGSVRNMSVVRDQQLPKRMQRTDYFSLDVRGSSPAASLCADLSQNFRLDSDASPRFPTPRRALFSEAIEKRAPMTTPPLLTSPPIVDMMDVSPAAHSGGPEIMSPTPAQAQSDDEMMVDTPVPASRQSSIESRQTAAADSRRRSAPRRPSLSRVKGLSLGVTVFGRAHTDNTIPQFKLGCDSKITHKSSALSLGECFEATSPEQVRSNNGSPSHARRPSNPFLRTRKQVRRSLSMFEHPGDIMKPKADEAQEVGAQSTTLHSAMDVDGTQQQQQQQQTTTIRLPHFFPDDPTDAIPRISNATLVELIEGKFGNCFDQKMMIDCRFEYEYDGGHIDGAVNYNDKELLADHLFRTPMQGRTLLVFHCEYSAHRAPLMARHIRAQDRAVNAESYPRLTYPEIYILDGGYSGFFNDHRGRCYPQNYIEMSDARHQRTCEREMGRLKARKNFGRAQTFAFGQSCVAESPTALGRPYLLQQSPIDMIGNSPILGERSHARRMASY